MDRVKRKTQGFFPTPALLAEFLLEEHFSQNDNIPTAILEPSAGTGVFAISTWDTLKNKYQMTKKQLETLVKNSVLFENCPSICKILIKNINDWCKSNEIESKPKIHAENFLLRKRKVLFDDSEKVLVVGNPPWDEFTKRKHDEGIDVDLRLEREAEKKNAQGTGYKNLYQCFLSDVLNITNNYFELVFVLPRQLLGDRASKDLRIRLTTKGSLNLTTFCNKEETDYCFETVAQTAEILCLSYVRKKKKSLKIRRGFKTKYINVFPYGDDRTIPCPANEELGNLLNTLLTQVQLSKWGDKKTVNVKRGKITYKDPDYKKAFDGRDLNAYYFDLTNDTRVVVNKILPDSKRKLKAAVVHNSLNVSDSLITIECEQTSVHAYLMLLLNSRPVEYILRSLVSNINLNNFRVLSLPIPPPTNEKIKLAKKLCLKCEAGKLDWDEASDSLALQVYNLKKNDINDLKNLYPNRITRSKDAA